MNRSTAAIIAFAIAGSLAAAPDSYAQARPGGAQGSSSGASHLPPPKSMQDPKKADGPVGLTAQVQATLERTADDIRINAAQEKAWNVFATRVIRLADDISRARFAVRAEEGEGVTALQLFDRISETAQNRQTAVEEIVEAGRDLYAKLSPTQQKFADKRLTVVVQSLASGVAPPPAARIDDGSHARREGSPLTRGGARQISKPPRRRSSRLSAPPSIRTNRSARARSRALAHTAAVYTVARSNPAGSGPTSATPCV